MKSFLIVDCGKSSKASVTVGFVMNDRINFIRSGSKWTTGGLLSACLLAILSSVVPAEETTARRQVYVPIEDLNVLLERDPNGVLLKRDEFNRLQSLADKNAASTPNNPSTAVTRGEYSARVTDSSLVVSATLEIRQFAAGWHSVQLPFNGVTVESAQIGENPARIGRSEDGSALTFWNDTAGTLQLTVEFSVPLRSVGSDRVAAFSVPPTPAASWRVTLPGGKRLLVDGTAATPVTTDDSGSEYAFALGGRNQVRLTMTDRTDQRDSDSMVFATSAVGLQVMPGELGWSASTELQVFGNDINRVELSVPKELEISEVESSGLDAWELKDDPQAEGRVRISLAYREPFRGIRRISLRGIQTVEAGTAWTAPTLSIAGGTSHVGSILIRYQPDIRLRVTEAAGVREVTAADTIEPAPSTRRPVRVGPAMRFDFFREDFALSIVSQPKARLLQAAASTIVDISTEELTLQFAGTLETRFAPLFEIELTVPAEWTLSQATLRGQPIPWRQSPLEAGVQTVVLAVDPPLAEGESLAVGLTAHRLFEQDLSASAAVVAIPEVQFPQAGVLEGTLVLRGDQELDISAEEVAGLEPASLNIPGERLGFRYQDSRFSGQLHIARKPARISSVSVVFAQLTRSNLKTHTDIYLDVTGGGTRELTLQMSPAVEDIRFESIAADSRLIEQTSETKDNQTVWTLKYDRPVREQLSLHVQYERPRVAEGAETVPLVQVLGAELEDSYVVFEARADQRLTITAKDADDAPLPEVDLLDLPATDYQPTERSVEAIRTSRPGSVVNVTDELFDREPVPTAVCPRAAHQTVIGRNGELQHVTTWQLQVVGVQGLQVSLPLGSGEVTTDPTLWAVLVNGQPVEARNVPGGFQIPLRQGSSDGDFNRQVQVYYRTVGRPLVGSGHLRQSPPRLNAIAGDGSLQPVEILNQDWDLTYSDELLLVDSMGTFEPTDEVTVPGLMTSLRDSLSISRPEELLRELLLFAATILSVLLIVAARRRAGILASLAVIVVIGGVVAALTVPVFAPFENTTGEAVAVKQDDFAVGFSGIEMQDEAGGLGMFGGGARLGVDDSLAFEGKSPSVISELAAAAEKAKPATSQPMSEVAKRELSMTERARRAIPQNNAFDSSNRSNALQSLAELDTDAKGMDRDRSRPADGVPPARPEAQGQADQFAMPTAPPLPASGQAERMAGNGLLSLSLALDAGIDTVTRRFASLSDQGDLRPAIDVVFEDQDARRTFRRFVTVAVIALFWFLRSWPVSVRAWLGVFGIVGPIAIVTLLPAAESALLDGILVGSAGGLLLWLVRYCASIESPACRWFCRKTKPLAKATRQREPGWTLGRRIGRARKLPM